ncbi:DUF3429 domain-containing protein [Sphingomonas solaris]|uniref:DUF3429 domain-containing protein n=1 Tax=Alterirhizorhabdus solaris TaxID=2529389 RepID=A0A558QTM5_9SPHN|nr:DUF3429 family protein [Sphingomonas solaris]TVV70491.1 DUF3429 domain-containing protein [Sphingomonas solaris]
MSRTRPIPPSSLVLGYGPMLLLPVLAIAGWSANGWWAALIVSAGQLWAAALLIFMAGVRRGYGFSIENGARPFLLVSMLWLFVLGMIGLIAPWLVAFCALFVGYGSVALLDPKAAARGELPRHFAKLRPPQMAVAMVGITALLLRALTL